MMIEFDNPTNADTILVPTIKYFMQMGYSRREAKQELAEQTRQLTMLGFQRVSPQPRRAP